MADFSPLFRVGATWTHAEEVNVEVLRAQGRGNRLLIFAAVECVRMFIIVEVLALLLVAFLR